MERLLRTPIRLITDTSVRLNALAITELAFRSALIDNNP
jgi:hypothetical protein